jgi:hypothetical protein
MSISESQRKGCIAVNQDADHDELVQIVTDLADTVREQNKHIEEQDKRIEEQDERIDEQNKRIDEQDERIDELQEQLKDERATRAKESAQDRQRIHQVEQAVEEQESPDTNPTPDTSETAQTDPLTPIERLSGGDREDIAQQVTPSVKRALALFEHLPDWGTSTPKGITLRPDDRPKDLLEATTGESLAWQQYYRACEALESLSKGAVTFVDHRRHGKTLVFHDNTGVHQRATATNHGDSRTSLVAD